MKLSPDRIEEMLKAAFTYQRTFDAIAAAVERNAVGIGISVAKFIAAFGPEQATHRHVKRGSEYVLIGVGNMQAEWWADELRFSHSGEDRMFQAVDMREVAIYRSIDDGSLWVRPREEFEDGRFVTLSEGSSNG